MSEIVITYDGAPLAYDVPPTKISVPQRAELGSISMGSLGIEDPTATLALVGHRPISVEELDCSQPRLFTGWVLDRNTGRSLEQGQFVGADPSIADTTIVDLNALWGFRIITGADGNRPSETIGVRLAWLLASSYLSGLIDDTGKVTYPAGVPMEPNDYRGRYPADVMGELLDLTQAPINWFAFWDPAPDTGSPRCGLYFDDVGAAANICTISISNVLADVNGTTVFAPNVEARLETTPETVYSDVIVTFANGSVYRTLAATETAHIKRGTEISRPRTGKVSTATAQGDAYLASHAHEVDRITCTIHVPSSVVGLLWAGQRMDVKFSHLAGYTTWTSMQIVASNPAAVDDLALWYDVALELVSPRVEEDLTGACTYVGADFLGYSSLDALGGAIYYTNIAYAAADPVYASSRVISGDGRGDGAFFGTANDGSRFGIQANVMGEGTIEARWTWDLLAAMHICRVGFYGGGNTTIEASNDALTWDTIAALGTFTPGGSFESVAVDPTTAYRYWSLHYGPVHEPPGLHYYAGVTHKCFMIWSATVVVTGGTIPPPASSGKAVEVTDPTVTDDEDKGYGVGAHWVNTASGEEFVLVDNTAGAAVWVSTTAVGSPLTVADEGTPLATAATTLDFVGAGVTASGTGAAKTITILAGAPTTADYLVGTAQAGLSAEIVVGTTPGGELGGTWASPTVDSVHSGSAHLALGSTGSTAAAGNHTHSGGELLITDAPAGSPLIFADLLQNEAGDDLLYSG